MILPHDRLLGPGIGDPSGADRTDARHVTQALGFRLDRVLDAIDRGWHQRFDKSRLELLAAGAIVDPFARRDYPFTGGDHSGVADNGDEFEMATVP